MALAAVDGPVVVAMIMHGALAVEEQSVLAGLQAQGAVGAEEEGVAVLGVGVGVHAVRIRAAGRAQQRRSLRWNAITDR